MHLGYEEERVWIVAGEDFLEIVEIDEGMQVAPLLVGFEGKILSARERAYFERVRPFGYLLFARNIESPEQVRALCAELREISGPDTVIAVDQEGGRVQRITFGGRLPPARVFGEWYDKDPKAALEACRLGAFLLAAQLREVGANLLLGPVLDLALPETHAVIGDRAFHADPKVVAALGGAYLDGVREGGCWGCIKHAPGHGRATADSHFGLPVVGVEGDDEEEWEKFKEILQTNDFVPFEKLADKADFMMTAHILYPQLDDVVATFSSEISFEILQSDFQFHGVLLADDVGMEALQGTYVSRIERALAAGCHVVIAALSKLQHGMAGTVFDSESFAALENADLPPMPFHMRVDMVSRRLAGGPDADAVAYARGRLMELWADGAGRMGYSLQL